MFIITKEQATWITKEEQACALSFGLLLERFSAAALTFSIWSASRSSLGSLRLGLNVSGSSSVLTVPCLEFTSSLVVIYNHKYLLEMH